MVDKNIYHRYKLACGKGKAYADNIDPAELTHDIQCFLQSNTADNHETLPSVVKFLMNKNYLFIPYSVQLKVNEFLIFLLDYSLKNISKDHPFLLKVINTILSPYNNFYNNETSAIPEFFDQNNEENKDFNEPDNNEQVVNQQNSDLNSFFYQNSQFFIKNKGFESLLQYSKEPIPLFQTTKVLYLLDIYYDKVPSFKSLSKQLIQVLTQKIKNLTDDELRTLQKQKQKTFFKTFEKLLQKLYNFSKSGKILENFELDLSIRFLSSKYLEKKIIGITDIISKINFANNREKASFVSVQNSSK